MRRVLIDVPRARGPEAIAAARACDGVNLARWDADAPDDEGSPARALVLAHVPNRAVERLVQALDDIEGHRLTLDPQGVLPLTGPPNGAPDQVTRVEARSPVEILLSGLQSIGSWTGLLGYSVAAGIIAWIGLFTNTIFLLVAAMLVAPYAGPAVNAALATARGDPRLLGRSLARYAAAIAVGTTTAAILSLLMRQQSASPLMVQVANVPVVAFLLALTAGAAGALNVAQSERSSLVSGAAVGILVAASLAPPAGVIGMAIVLGEWGMVTSSAYLLALQLVAINLAGALVFLLYGVTPRGSRYERGRKGVATAALAGTLALLVLLVSWQLSAPPELQRGTLEQRAVEDARQAIESSGVATFVHADARFVRESVDGAPTLLVTVYAAAAEGDASAEDAQALEQQVATRLRSGSYHATPLVHVTLLHQR